MHARFSLPRRALRVVALIAVIGALTGCQAGLRGTVTPATDQTTGSPGEVVVAAPANAGIVRASNLAAAAAATPTTQRGIVVSGTGHVSAKPDRAMVSAGVQSRAATAREAHDATNRTMQAVIAAIKGMGIPDTAIRTSGIALYPTSDDKNAITGYAAMNTVTVTVDDVNQAGAVLDTAVGAGANTGGNVQFTLKDPTTLRNQALVAAIGDAKAKSAVVAEAIGIATPGILAVSEGGVSEPVLAAADGRGAAAGSATPIEPGEITVTAQVSVTFGS